MGHVEIRFLHGQKIRQIAAVQKWFLHGSCGNLISSHKTFSSDDIEIIESYCKLRIFWKDPRLDLLNKVCFQSCLRCFNSKALTILITRRLFFPQNNSICVIWRDFRFFFFERFSIFFCFHRNSWFGEVWTVLTETIVVSDFFLFLSLLP